MKGYTIQHSIDLLEKAVENGGGSGGASTAAEVSYSNTSSHLVATNVQSAIDELNTTIGSIDTSEHYLATESEIGDFLGSTLYRKVIDLGNLPNATTKNVAHEIENLGTVVSIIGVAHNSSGNNLPLPYVHDTAVASQIKIFVNTTNVSVASSHDYSEYTGHIILEYTKATAPASNTRKKSSK